MTKLPSMVFLYPIQLSFPIAQHTYVISILGQHYQISHARASHYSPLYHPLLLLPPNTSSTIPIAPRTLDILNLCGFNRTYFPNITDAKPQNENLASHNT